MAFNNPNELFLSLYEKIMNRDITTFQELVDHMDKQQISFNIDSVMEKAFRLIKELHWGFFKDMEKKGFLKLWKELVVGNEKYKDMGDLKRNMSISNIYIGLMDIHGYTRFCEECKDNLSRLHSLDQFLHEGVKTIARENGTLAKRERGDEIIVIAASATDIINTVLGIINSFSRKPIIQDETVIRDRSNYNINLPDFKISAGIAGGNFVNPLIVTEDGVLSGFLLSVAARLQVRANELSPTQTKILVTRSIYTNFMEENKISKSILFRRNLLSFFDQGPVEFKNVTLSSSEIVFRPEEKYKEKYAEQISILFQAINSNNWKLKVFTNLLDLVRYVVHSMPAFNLTYSCSHGDEMLTPSSLSTLCEQAQKLFEEEEDYIEAVNMLSEIIDRLESLDDFDRLVLDYARGIQEQYHHIIQTFEKALYQEINKNIDMIFDEKHKIIYHNMKKNTDIFERLKTFARRSKALTKRKTIWNTVIENCMPHLKTKIHSGK
ncbi:MAG: hypothetical protein PHF84_01725 [bacterium]|nr:hypothetical protein [bacterium]